MPVGRSPGKDPPDGQKYFRIGAVRPILPPVASMTRPSDKSKKAAPKPDPKAPPSKSAAKPAPKVAVAPPVEVAAAPPPEPFEIEGSPADHVAALLGESQAAATKSARILSEAAARRADLLAPFVDRFVKGLTVENKRVAQTAGEALPAIAKIAPARVAKHLDALRDAFGRTTDEGKDGLVRTWAALCAASVAYQKRLEPCLTHALGEADPKTLVRWTEVVLPSLKGEPHARARAVVEERLESLPRPQAQSIADFLGIKLRPARKP